MKRTLCLLPIFAGLALTGCQHGPFFNDTTRGPDEFNDPTVIVSACEMSIGRGVDVCRFVQGSKIESKLTVVLPWNHQHAINGTVRVRYKDQVRIYEVKGPVFELAYRDLLGADSWELDHDGPIQIVGNLNFMNGSEQQRIRLFGYIFAAVLKPGHNPFPVNPGRPFMETTCKIKYNELGDSRLTCEQR